jgi:hypothetical protein
MSNASKLSIFDFENIFFSVGSDKKSLLKGRIPLEASYQKLLITPLHFPLQIG